MFPSKLAESGFRVKKWPASLNSEEFIFDFRQQTLKDAIRMSQNLSTFKHEYDFWEERPQLILCEEGNAEFPG